MKIVETNLKFRDGLKERRSTKRVVVHHSDTLDDVSAAVIHKWHLARTNPIWAGIGYHFVIRMDGTIERGRPIDTIGSHAGPKGNPDSIGVCIIGNFTLSLPKAAQVESFVELLKSLEKLYGPLELNGHREFMATQCPGDRFPMDDIKALVDGSGTDMQANDVKVVMDGIAVDNSYIMNVNGKDTTYIPAVALRNLGFKVLWDSKTKTVTISKEG